jgi:hypothetical protein
MGSLSRISDRSHVTDETRLAFSAYSESSASTWPYSFTVTPHPLAVITMHSAPDSNKGHQASILRRMVRRALSSIDKWSGKAPQQPTSGALVKLIPSRSRTRAAAAFVFGLSVGCAQPSSTIICLDLLDVGISPAA